MDEGGKIVELLTGNGEWLRTTLRDAEFICNTFGYDRLIHVRKNEGSLDGGITWKEFDEDELELLSIEVCEFIQWRVKGH